MNVMKGEGLARFSGPPRSLIWRGGAVHVRCCAAGRNTPELHAHFAHQLTVGFCGDVSLRGSRRDPERLAPGWLIRSDRAHWLVGSGVGVTFFLDPVSAAGRLLATRFGGEDAAPLDAEECAAIRQELNRYWERGWRAADLRPAADRIARSLARPGVVPPPIDRRVQLALRALQTDPAARCSLAELAGRTRLSESRLAHLFRRDVGLPVRQYRLALRMEEAAREIAAGTSLTRAAYLAGFADPAHFSRICRRMYGGPPSRLPAFELDS